MNSENYIELQVTSNFSFLRGASHPEELIKAAANLGYRALALTDLHTLSGIVRAFEAAKETGLTLIVGTALELYEEADEFEEGLEANSWSPNKLPLRLYLYATSIESYGNMCSLLTKGKMRAPKGSCFLTLADVATGTEGLVAAIDLI